MNAYIITYDIRDPRRLRSVFKTMKGFGYHLQYSVFLCQLSRRKLVHLQCRLETQIEKSEDQVIFVDIGPVGGRSQRAISSIGKAHFVPPEGPIIA